MISYKQPEQRVVEIGEHIEWVGTVIEPDERLECLFCGATRERVRYMVKSTTGACICDECAVYAARLVLESLMSGREAQ